MKRVGHRVCFFMLLWGVLFSVETKEIASGQMDAAALEQDESSRQLRIYTDALYQGSTEAVRVDAAIGLLLRKDPESRQVLLEALGGSDNPSALVAVCRGLIYSRSLGPSVAPAEVFVDPLIEILSGSNESMAHLAAEALLLYPFTEVESALTAQVQNRQMSSAVRLHGIYALQLRTHPQALRILIGLMDDPNPDVTHAAEIALQEAFGIPVGTNLQVWSAILGQLDQSSPADIQRQRLLRQETKLRQVQEESDRWQRLYLASLDTEYETQDPATRSSFLLERLNSDLPAIRLWALGKVMRLTGESSPEMRERLLNLLSDSDRDVRLQTARVLTTMSILNPAEHLLAQYNKEEDPKVALALFEALGEACFFAFSPGSTITLPESIRSQTLEIALMYLSSSQPLQAKTGSEVIRKLMELNGIDSYEAAVYLTALLDRYQKGVDSKQGSSLRGDLLMIMARLATQGPHKASAGHLYRQAFMNGLQDMEHPEIRLAGVKGLIGIDKTTALTTCKENNLTNDPSPAIREVLLNLAGQVGTSEDLEWIEPQFLKNDISDIAWNAFRAICQRQDVEVCVSWAKQLTEQKIQKERLLQLWDMAEQKAQTDNNMTLLEEIWKALITLYSESNDYQQLLELENRIRTLTGRSDILEAAGPEFLKASLQAKQWKRAEMIMRDALAAKDLDSADPLMVLIEDYMNSPENDFESKQSLKESLINITLVPKRPKWDQKISLWQQEIETIQEGDQEQEKEELVSPEESFL